MTARRGMSLLAGLIGLLAATSIVAGCGEDSADASKAGAMSASSPPDVRVFAAASLSDAFEEMAKSYAARIEYSFAGSQILRTQLEQGARADVFASADKQQMTLAQHAGVIEGDGVVFARNRLVIVLPKDNPKEIAAPADLAKPGVKIVLAAPDVPAGAYSRGAIERLGALIGPEYTKRVLSNVVSGEEDVRRVLTKVQLGEADAGIVYTSDVAAAPQGAVLALTLPDVAQPNIEYFVGAVKDGNVMAAKAFIDLLRGAAGREALEGHGLLPAP